MNEPVTTDYDKLRTDVNYLQRGLNDVRNIAVLLPLLDKFIGTSDNLSGILPFLLFSGGWGQSGSGGGMFGGDNSGIMMLAVIIALQDKDKVKDKVKDK